MRKGAGLGNRRDSSNQLNRMEWNQLERGRNLRQGIHTQTIVTDEQKPTSLAEFLSTIAYQKELRTTVYALNFFTIHSQTLYTPTRNTHRQRGHNGPRYTDSLIVLSLRFTPQRARQITPLRDGDFLKQIGRFFPLGQTQSISSHVRLSVGKVSLPSRTFSR